MNWCLLHLVMALAVWAWVVMRSSPMTLSNPPTPAPLQGFDIRWAFVALEPGPPPDPLDGWVPPGRAGPQHALPVEQQWYGGSLKRSARAVQLFGRLAVLETHTLRY